MELFCFEVNSISDIGNSRQSNQDRCTVRLGNIEKIPVALLCVADGMGGLSEGEFASETAIWHVESWWERSIAYAAEKSEKSEVLLKRFQDELDDLLQMINQEILSYSKKKESKIGTTFSLVFFFDQQFYLLHVGDSRIYRIGKRKIDQISRDDTWVQEQIEKGLLQAEEAEFHPKRNVLTNCLGAYEKPGFQRQKGKVTKDEMFFLCSDGLYGVFDQIEMLGVLERGRADIEKTLQNLIDLAKRRGSTDNITAAVNMIKRGKLSLFS